MADYGVFVDPNGVEHVAGSPEHAVELQFGCGYPPKVPTGETQPPAQREVSAEAPTRRQLP